MLHLVAAQQSNWPAAAMMALVVLAQERHWELLSALVR